MKPFWKSKTVWVNAITLGLHFAKPYVGIETIPDVNPSVLAVANIVLRLITKQPVGLD